MTTIADVTRTTRETAGAVKRRQMVVPRWLDEISDDVVLTVETAHLPFGSYLLSARPADEGEATDDDAR